MSQPSLSEEAPILPPIDIPEEITIPMDALFKDIVGDTSKLIEVLTAIRAQQATNIHLLESISEEWFRDKGRIQALEKRVEVLEAAADVVATP